MGSFTRLAPTMWKASCDHTLPSLVPFHSLQVLLLLATQWPIRAPVKLLGGALWRPCNVTPIHSLTGPVGHLFTSRLGGQQFARHRDAPTLSMEPGSPVAMSRYIYAASSHLSSARMMAPTLSCAADPASSPFESGRGTRSSPSSAWRLTPVLRSQTYFFWLQLWLRLSKSFHSGSSAGSDLSFVVTRFHSFQMKK